MPPLSIRHGPRDADRRGDVANGVLVVSAFEGKAVIPRPLHVLTK
jgi:hypothetical protein